MIHAYPNADGDRTVHECTEPLDSYGCTLEQPHGTYLGVIERGRAMTDLNSEWTEFQFVPSDLTEPVFPVRRSYSAAREDARLYAQGRP